MDAVERAVEDMRTFIETGFYNLNIRKDRRRARSYLAVMIGSNVNPLAEWAETKRLGRQYLYSSR